MCVSSHVLCLCLLCVAYVACIDMSVCNCEPSHGILHLHPCGGGFLAGDLGEGLGAGLVKETFGAPGRTCQGRARGEEDPWTKDEADESDWSLKTYTVEIWVLSFSPPFPLLVGRWA